MYVRTSTKLPLYSSSKVTSRSTVTVAPCGVSLLWECSAPSKWKPKPPKKLLNINTLVYHHYFHQHHHFSISLSLHCYWSLEYHHHHGKHQHYYHQHHNIIIITYHFVFTHFVIKFTSTRFIVSFNVCYHHYIVIDHKNITIIIANIITIINTIITIIIITMLALIIITSPQ